MYNTTDLVNAVKRNCAMPGNSPIRLSDTQIIAVVNEELRWLIATELVNMNEDFFIESEIVPLVGSQNTYRMPSKAASWVLDAIYVLSQLDNVETRLPRRSRKSEQVGGIDADSPTSCFIEDTNIRLYPNLSANPIASLKFYYNRIQNLLTQLSNCGQITNITNDTVNYTFSVTAIPSGYTSGIDIINGSSPYDLIAKDIVVTAGSLTITAKMTDFDIAPNTGDWIAQTGYTVYPHIPSEWHPLLAQAASVRALEISGDKANQQTAATRLGTMIEQMRKATKDRLKGSPKKLVPRCYVLNAQRYRYRWY